MLAAALAAGARQIILGVGGSASTDGGAGLLQALGARVLDARGEPLARGGAALRDVATLDLAGLHLAPRTVATPDLSGLRTGLRQATVILATNVVNPLTGPDGAAEVYGPAEGRLAGADRRARRRVRRWAAVVAAATGTDRSQAPGPARRAGSASRPWPSSARRRVPASSWCSTWWTSTPRWTAPHW